MSNVTIIHDIKNSITKKSTDVKTGTYFTADISVPNELVFIKSPDSIISLRSGFEYTGYISLNNFIECDIEIQLHPIKINK